MYEERDSENYKRDLESSAENPPIKVLGVYLCGSCRNIIKPSTCDGSELQFDCKTCGKRYLDYMKRYDEDCTLATHEVHRTLPSEHISANCMLDPTMPRYTVTCPKCGHQRAVCVFIPNSSQNYIEAKLMCASIRDNEVHCGHVWILNSKNKIEGEEIEERNMPLSKFEEYPDG